MTLQIEQQDREWLEAAKDKIINKMVWVSEKSKFKIPFTTNNEEHDDCQKNGNQDHGISWWTNGFWGGILWLLYNETNDSRYADIANYSEKALDQCFEDYYGLHHDVGFMWLPTAVANYRITGSAESRKRGLHAANLLAGRFNPVGKFIRAWNDFNEDNRGWAIIDCMMNIPLLYWASDETKDPRFKQIAMLHADTVMENFIRPDGSSNHIVGFDPVNGGVVETFGGQGYENGSSWTRGQSWALYGFILSYIHTDKVEYLNTAKRVAHYFMANIPENGFIPVDFRQPKEPVLEDSSAATIAAAGLVELAKCVGDLEQEMYLKAALKLLRTLYENRCNWTESCDCIIEKCSGAYHDPQHHINLIYGDYYFIEAVFKLTGKDILLW